MGEASNQNRAMVPVFTIHMSSNVLWSPVTVCQPKIYTVKGPRRQTWQPYYTQQAHHKGPWFYENDSGTVLLDVGKLPTLGKLYTERDEKQTKVKTLASMIVESDKMRLDQS